MGVPVRGVAEYTCSSFIPKREDYKTEKIVEAASPQALEAAARALMHRIDICHNARFARVTPLAATSPAAPTTPTAPKPAEGDTHPYLPARYK